MKIVDKEIEDWIKPYATIIGDSLNVDEKLRETNPINYFLRVTVPKEFDKYAIALHSFWINNKIPNGKIRYSVNLDEDTPEEDYDRVKWKDFYTLKNENFDLQNFYKSPSKSFNQFEQLNNELFPGEGLMDIEHIKSLIETILDLYGDQEIELFYTFLATSECDKDRIYNGRISELEKLLNSKELHLTPSLIYPKERNWVVNTDYDLPFSFLGGESELISRLVNKNRYELYELKY